MNRLLYAILFITIFVAVPVLHAVAPSADDLRKAAQNLMAREVSMAWATSISLCF